MSTLLRQGTPGLGQSAGWCVQTGAVTEQCPKSKPTRLGVMWQVGAKQGVRGLGKLIPWQSSRWRSQWQGEQCLWKRLHIWNIPGQPRSPDQNWKGSGAWGLVGPSLACREGAEMIWAKDTVVIVWKALSLETWSTFSALSINWISPDFPWAKAWTWLETVCEFRSSMFSVWCRRQSVYHNHTTCLHWAGFSAGHRVGKWLWPSWKLCSVSVLQKPSASVRALIAPHPLTALLSPFRSSCAATAIGGCSPTWASWPGGWG